MVKSEGKFFLYAVKGGWLCLNGLSFVGTATGIWMLLLGLSENQSLAVLDTWILDAAEVGLALVGSAIIQIFVAGFWSAASNALRPMLHRMIFAGSGGVFSVLSGTLGAAFWAVTLQVSVHLAEIENDKRMRGVFGPLGTFAARNEQVSLLWSDLAQTMAVKMEVETSRGASCDGDPVRDGPGPRYRMRERVEKEAEEHAAAASALSQAAYDAISLPAEVDDVALAAALSKARAVAGDRRVLAMRRWAEALIADFEGAFNDAETGQDFVCRDTAVVEELKAALALLVAPTDLPVVPPRAASAGFDAAMSNSFGQVAAVLGPVIGLNVQADPLAFEKTKPAFVAALAVEAAIVLLSFVIGLLSSVRDPNSGPGPRPIDPGDRDHLMRRMAIWNALLREGRPRALFYVPEDGDDPEIRAAAQTEVDRFGMRMMPIGEAIDLSIVAPMIHQGLAQVSGGARRFRVYMVPRRALAWRRQMSIDLADGVT